MSVILKNWKNIPEKFTEICQKIVESVEKFIKSKFIASNVGGKENEMKILRMRLWKVEPRKRQFEQINHKLLPQRLFW